MHFNRQAKARPVSLFAVSLLLTAWLALAACSQNAQTGRMSDDERFVRETYEEVNPSNASTGGSPEVSGAADLSGMGSSVFVTQLGFVNYNRHTLPVVSPDGKFIAVQEGLPPSWETILSEQGAPRPPTGSIVIYRVEKNSRDNDGLVLYVHDRLDDIGLLGRNADANGFLIESPQESNGARWIGYVSWQTGEVKWLVQGSNANAFAALHSDGRLAWCRRDTDDGRFHLIVQGKDAVYRLPAVGGDWLMPVWAEDGRTLFAFFLHDDGALDLAALDGRSESLLQEPIGMKHVLSDATIQTAYQCLAPIQNAQAPDGSARMLFFHPGNNRMAVADFERHGVRLLTADTMAGVWHDQDSFLLAGMEALVRLDGDDPIADPSATLIRSVAVPRRTESDLARYVLICPSSNEPGKVYLWAMHMPEDDSLAREAPRSNQ